LFKELRELEKRYMEKGLSLNPIRAPFIVTG